jgi:fructokinase
MVDCVVIGDVMFDVFFQNEERHPVLSRRGTSYCSSAKIDFGGAGNVASALSLLGAKVLFVGKAGNDLWGKIYEADLIAHSVATNILFAKRISTGLALVTREKNCERSFFLFRGANNKLLKEEVNLSANALKNSDYLYFSGCSLVSNPQKRAILYAVNLAKRYNLKVIFDPGSHNLIKSNFKLFERLSNICDVFCPNLEEAKMITRTNQLQKIIERLQKRGRLTAVKCGEDGCILIKENEVLEIVGNKVKPLDTTGAGDAFIAALIYGLVKNLPYRTIGKLANWFAAQTVKGIGARAFPSKIGIERYLLHIFRET